LQIGSQDRVTGGLRNRNVYHALSFPGEAEESRLNPSMAFEIRDPSSQPEVLFFIGRAV